MADPGRVFRASAGAVLLLCAACEPSAPGGFASGGDPAPTPTPQATPAPDPFTLGEHYADVPGFEPLSYPLVQGACVDGALELPPAWYRLGTSPERLEEINPRSVDEEGQVVGESFEPGTALVDVVFSLDDPVCIDALPEAQRVGGPWFEGPFGVLELEALAPELARAGRRVCGAAVVFAATLSQYNDAWPGGEGTGPRVGDRDGSICSGKVGHEPMGFVGCTSRAGLGEFLVKSPWGALEGPLEEHLLAQYPSLDSLDVGHVAIGGLIARPDTFYFWEASGLHAHGREVDDLNFDHTAYFCADPDTTVDEDRLWDDFAQARSQAASAQEWIDLVSAL